MLASTSLFAWFLLLGGTGVETAPDFDSQIVPVFTRAGCNVAACHGAAAGRGGFHLSLWGLDPAADYEAIVRELKGRRVNLAVPENSLLLLKGTCQLDHGGEDALSRAPNGEQRILEWIRQGAPRGNGRRLARLQVSPAGTTVLSIGQAVELRSIAFFEDGSREDVTAWTVFSADDPTAVLLRGARPTAGVTRGGRHVVLARYLDQVIPLVFVSPLSSAPVEFVDEDRRNEVDEPILATLSELGLPVSRPADDRTLARRLYLDLAGRLPTTEEVREFCEDSSAAKREHLVDRLLRSEDFIRFWTYRLATLMRVRSQPQDQAGAARFHQWLGQQLRAGTAYDEMVRQLLTAEGDTHEIGPANFYRVANGARDQAEYVSELLMGARLRCANCHNHPLDRWTQDDYHGLAALFARVEPGRVVRIGTRGRVSHPKTGQPARPRIPGERFLDDQGDPREALADWMTDADNPYFATAIVNRLWRFLMGRGLIEPPDDVRSTNPPSHPDLLDFLATDFREHGCDIRRTLRTIALSAAYARSCKPPSGFPADRVFYSHAIVRPLEAEVLADAIADVTGIPDRYPGHPSGTRAVALFDPKTPAASLDVLGRCSREQSCEGVPATATLTQWLHMLNGSLVNERLRSADGRLHKSLACHLPDDALVREFYAVALSRTPTAAEADFWREQLQGADARQRRDVLEDFVWSLLVCREFITNH